MAATSAANSSLNWEWVPKRFEPLFAAVDEAQRDDVVLAGGELQSVAIVTVVEVAQQEGRAAALDDVAEIAQRLADVGAVALRAEGDKLADDA